MTDRQDNPTLAVIEQVAERGVSSEGIPGQPLAPDAAPRREMTPWEIAWAVVQWAKQQDPKGEPLRPVEIGLSHLEAVVDLYRQRRAVGQWLRVRLQHEATLRERYESIIKHNPDPIAGIFGQLAADIDHSSLLLRLLKGKEPLPEPPPLSHAYPVYPDK